MATNARVPEQHRPLATARVVPSPPAVDAGYELLLLVEDETEGACLWLLEAEVRHALRTGVRHFCLDLSELRHCGDALLTTLVRCQRMVRAAGGRLSVVASSVAVRRALVTIGLDRHLRTGPLSSAEVDW